MSPTLALLLLAAGNPPVVPVPALPQACPTCPPGAPGLPNGPCPPIGPPAPLLGVRVLAPDGVTVTFTPGVPDARAFVTPVTAGLRPGYRYTLKLTGLPGRDPAVAIYPVVEVLGTIVPRPGMKYMEYPAPLAITRGDIARALAGALVTKVAYLENPVKAVPVEALPDQPLEFTELTEDDAFMEARANGRPVLVLRFGDRRPDAAELAVGEVPGTILLPGQNTLGAPAGPPPLAACGIPLYDPIAGPRQTPEECITDGGDKFPFLGVGPNGQLGGLNPTDVALEFTAGGKRRVATSNEVCVCAPRFVLRKVEVVPGGLQLAGGVALANQANGLAVGSRNVGPEANAARSKPIALVGRERPAIVYQVEGVAVVEQLAQIRAVASIEGLQVIVSAVGPDEITNEPNQMVVTKSVEPAGPVQSGDTVTFTIRYRNGTPFAATDLLLSDSLSPRLKYVTDSAQTDRPANRTTFVNEAGSTTVRFEVPGPIPPGGTGTVKFQAKVR
jgi:uncharacterized repeat protein (TIGR01451 family)